MKPDERTRQGGMSRLAPFLALGAMLLSLPLVAGYWGAVHPAFDTLAHFRVHLALLMLVPALPLVFVRGWRRIGLMIAVLSLASLSSTAVSQVRSAGAQPPSLGYRLLHLNLLHDNGEPEKVLSLIARTEPDVVTLNEVSAAWDDALERLADSYPHRIVCPPPSPIGGVAILSRRPFSDRRPPECFDRGAMAIATVDFDGREVDVAAIHLGWPWPFGQDVQVQRVAGPLARLAPTALLAGDLNAAPWSRAARRVAAAGGLETLGGIGPTWLHRALPDPVRRFAGLPIDNVLVKGGIVPRRPLRLEDAGSDHLPVLVEFALLREENPADVLQASAGR